MLNLMCHNLKANLSWSYGITVDYWSCYNFWWITLGGLSFNLVTIVYIFISCRSWNFEVSETLLTLRFCGLNTTKRVQVGVSHIPTSFTWIIDSFNMAYSSRWINESYLLQTGILFRKSLDVQLISFSFIWKDMNTLAV